jgi:hypothetical protein
MWEMSRKYGEFANKIPFEVKIIQFDATLSV